MAVIIAIAMPVTVTVSMAVPMPVVPVVSAIAIVTVVVAVAVSIVAISVVAVVPMVPVPVSRIRLEVSVRRGEVAVASVAPMAGMEGAPLHPQARPAGVVAVELAIAVGVGAVVHVAVDPHRKQVRGVLVAVRLVVLVALVEDVEVPRPVLDAQRYVRQGAEEVRHRVAHVVVHFMRRRQPARLGARWKQAEAGDDEKCREKAGGESTPR